MDQCLPRRRGRCSTSRWGPPVLLGLTLLAASMPGPTQAFQPAAAPTASRGEIWDPQLLRQAGLDPKRIHCNPSVQWVPSLRSQLAETIDQIQAALPAGATADPAQLQRFRDAVSELLFWRMVRLTIVDTDQHNAGVIRLRGFRWRDANGVMHPVLVFRSAITRIDPDAPSCVRSLLSDGGVRHVVNLYDADRIPIGSLLQREQALARSCQATYLPPQEAVQRYGHWREQLREQPAGRGPDPAAMDALARLIREQILAPGGRPPQGNVYVHCGGGMHRSGMVMGILERCVNGLPMAAVRRRYLWHTGWQSPEHPGGAEQGNLNVIAAFDCGSLGPLPSP